MTIVKAKIKTEAEFIAIVELDDDGEVISIDSIEEIIEVDDEDVDVREIITKF